MTSLIGVGRVKKVSIFEQDNPLNSLTVDASVDEAHSGTSSATDHPVEGGADLTDHITVAPEGLQLTVVVSNHPIVFARSLFAQPAVNGGDVNNRAEDAYGFLKDLQDRKKIVGASTALRDYADMFIADLSVPREAGSSNSVNMSVSLRRINIAVTETVDAPQPTNPARKNKSSLGKKNKPPSSPATSQKAGGLLERFFGIFGG